MKILHAPYCFHPDPVGGTEVYVENLARSQQRQGADVAIAAPGLHSERYDFRELEVHRFGTGQRIEVSQLYGAGDPVAAAAFQELLISTRPDLIHLHAFTSALSIQVVKAAKQAGIPVVFTYHTPTVSCQRGNLLRWGTEICSGRLDVRSCTECSLQGRGLGRNVSRLLARIPTAAGRALGRAGFSGGAWTALRMPELVSLRHGAFFSLMREVDVVVSLCSWCTELLLENGVGREKITLCRHGLQTPAVPIKVFEQKPEDRSQGYRVVFLGRITPVKGLDILVESIAAAPDLEVTLDIYGVTQSSIETAHLDRLRERADKRICFRDPIRPDQSINCLRQYDLLAVPSQGIETGPLVVLEAFAAGIPVIASDLGGIREVVRHGVDGLLVETRSITAWTAAFRRLSEEPDLLPSLRREVTKPRDMETVASEMLSLYRTVLTNRSERGLPAYAHGI